MCPGPVDEVDDIPPLSLSAPVGAAQVFASTQAVRSEAPTSEGSDVGHVPDAGRDSRTERPALEYWFKVLREAVDATTAESGWAMAAGVSARMRYIDPSFSPGAVGFSKFRSFLNAAMKAGVVSLLPAEETGAADTGVRTFNAQDPAGAEGGVRHDQSPERNAERLASPVWRAVLDWHPVRCAVYDRQQRRVLFLGNGHLITSTQVNVPHVDRSTHISWMRDFVAELPEAEQRDRLAESLDADDPVAHFNGVLRSDPAMTRSWRKYHRSRVTAVVDAWAIANDIPKEDLRARSASNEGRLVDEHSLGGDPPSIPSNNWAPNPLDASGSDAVRQRVVRAVELMPLSELLRLPIPVEYLLR